MGIFKAIKINDDMFVGNDFIEDYDKTIAKITSNPEKTLGKMYIPSTITNFVESVYECIELDKNFKYGMFYQRQKENNIEIIVFNYDDIVKIFNLVKEKHNTKKDSIEYLKNELLNSDLEEFTRKIYGFEKEKEVNKESDFTKTNTLLLSCIKNELKDMDIDKLSELILNIAEDDRNTKYDKKIMLMIVLQSYIAINYKRIDNAEQEKCTDYVSGIKSFINKMNE